MTKVTNISAGPRGFHDKKSGLVMLDPGQSATEVEMDEAEMKSARETGYFEFDKAEAKKPEPDKPAKSDK